MDWDRGRPPGQIQSSAGFSDAVVRVIAALDPMHNLIAETVLTDEAKAHVRSWSFRPDTCWVSGHGCIGGQGVGHWGVHCASHTRNLQS